MVFACASLIVGAAVVADEEEKPTRIWSHDWLLRRPSHDSYFTLQKELRLEKDLFQHYLKVPVEAPGTYDRPTWCA